MLRLTPGAIDHLLTVRREKGHDASALPRFVRRAGRLALTFAGGPESGDRLVETPRVATLVAASAADLLDDATIDVRTRAGTSSLVVRRRQRMGGPA
jgi:Fe-S cluster assembly iron-binding protein IscA